MPPRWQADADAMIGDYASPGSETDSRLVTRRARGRETTRSSRDRSWWLRGRSDGIPRPGGRGDQSRTIRSPGQLHHPDVRVVAIRGPLNDLLAHRPTITGARHHLRCPDRYPNGPTPSGRGSFITCTCHLAMLRGGVADVRIVEWT